MKKILIALDKFKGALEAPEACSLVKQTLQQCGVTASISMTPLTDGGDGFVQILTDAARGTLHSHTTEGADGVERNCHYGIAEANKLPSSVQQTLQWQDGPFALVEMAQTSGLAAIPPEQRNPWKTHCRGLGRQLAAIAQSGINRILLGIGGSATQDMGLPALIPLGLQLLSASNTPLQPSAPEQWQEVHRIVWTPVFPNLQIVLASDVTNPLLGERGTASVFAVQKGLPSVDIPLLERANARMAGLLERDLNLASALRETPGGGAAGGIGYGFHAILGSRIVNGSSLIQNWFQLEQQITSADLLITGEGRADRGTLDGKGPGAVMQLAWQHRKKVLVLAGQIEAGLAEQSPPNTHWRAITPIEVPLPQALANTRTYLCNAVRDAVRDGLFS